MRSAYVALVRRVVALALALACAACTSSTTDRSTTTPADYCALAALPTRTLGDVEILQTRLKAARAAHSGHGVNDVVKDPGIAQAVLKVEVAIDPALEEMRIATTDDSAATSRGPVVARLDAAQDELRVACAAH